METAAIDLKQHLLAECQEDHVGLWYILANVERELHPLDAGTARQLTMQMVRELLESGRIQAGHPTPDGRGFIPWNCSPAEALTRIESEWDALGHEPNIGDIVWFTTRD